MITIRQRTGLQGRLMARLLLNQLDPPVRSDWPEGVHDLESGSLVLEVELVVRDSG